MQYKILLVLPFFEYLSSVAFWLGAVFLNQVWHPVGFDTCPRETGSVPKTKFQSSRVGISRLFRPVRWRIGIFGVRIFYPRRCSKNRKFRKVAGQLKCSDLEDFCRC